MVTVRFRTMMWGGSHDDFSRLLVRARRRRCQYQGCALLGQARALPFELWKRPDELGHVLAALAATFAPSDRIALTMTAELCDCYPTKAVGVNAVLDAALDAFLGRPIHVWGVDGAFHSVEEVRRQPLIAAAANWIALATVVARLVPEGPGLLIDIGTTTTDLIPLKDGRMAARGQTDTERLQAGELTYAGVRRTPICAWRPNCRSGASPRGWRRSCSRRRSTSI